MENKIALLSIIPLLLLSSCSTVDGKDSDNKTDGETTQNVDGKTDEEKEAYDAWLNSISKAGHLYFHYNRGEETNYSDYALWLWQHSPNDLEGSLWAYSGPDQVSTTLTLKPMSRSWMTLDDVGKSGNDIYHDDYGAIADVDLYKSGLVGGKTGSATTFEGASELGFLLPRINSMNGRSNWVSDGGKETYIPDFSEAANWRTLATGGKAIHIFVSTGALKKYTYYVGSGAPQVAVNPITADTSGDFRSDSEDYDGKFKAGSTSTSSEFKKLGVGYQIFVASFRDSNGDGKGDIRGIINSLDYLEDLGVQCLWLTPIQKSDSYHGYDTIDYYKVDEKFGTLDDYRELIYKAHEKGMKVLMDLVLNHTSKSNVWFENSQWGVNDAGRKNEWRDVYTWKYETDQIWKFKEDGTKTKITVKQDAESENPSWYRDGESHYYYYGKFGGSMPEINYYSPKTRQMVIDMAKYWLSFGLDGYRLDAVKHIFMRDECGADEVDKCIADGDIMLEDFTTKRYHDDEKGTDVAIDVDYATNLSKNVAWWRQFATALKADYPSCFLVGENFDGWGKRTAPYYEALDSQFSFAQYYHIPTYLFAKGNAALFKADHAETYDCYATNDTYELDGKGISLPGGHRNDFIDGSFTSNHDVMRAINQANGTLNDAGDGTNANPSVNGSGDQINKAKIHAAVTLLNRGLSWIYYGDELGMSSNTDQHIPKYQYDNNMDIWYRQPMKWGDSSQTSYKHGQYLFELDNYNISNDNVPTASDQQSNPNSMYSWYKELIALKKMYPDDSRLVYHESTNENVLVIRVCDSSWNTKMVIYINTGANANEYLMNPTSIFGNSNFSNVKALGGAPSNVGGNIGGVRFSLSAFAAN
ncbi:MAG: hypothetical protein K6E11_03660 [Bacilli bacterium]|nr:hypothetical protein [Bacilli bacterium]